MAKDKRSVADLKKQVNTLTREVMELRRGGEVPAEQQANMRAAQAREAGPGEGRGDYLTVRPGNAEYGRPVRDHMERLQGRSRSDTVADNQRGAASPLGGGTHSKARRR
jgi:hypothetical protein